MNENINLVKILRDVPFRTTLWSPLCGECKFVNINIDSAFPITVSTNKGDCITFTEEGFYRIDGVECLLFPSSDNRDWTTFKTLSKHKYFKTYQKVLVAIYFASYNGNVWHADLYSHFDKKRNVHSTVGSGNFSDDEILPYEGNENLVGKLVE